MAPLRIRSVTGTPGFVPVPGVVACPTVRLKTAWARPFTVLTWTWAGPAVKPSVADAETIPFESDVDTIEPRETDDDACQITCVFGTGFPRASSTLAVNRAGNEEPGAPL